MLEIDHISFSYGRRRILRDITFDVAPGEIVAVVGPNGAGKTTLINVLASVLMQDSGRVRLDEVDSLKRPLRYRKKIGFLSETCPLYPEMTVEAYLTYRVRLRDQRSLRVRRRVSEALNVCGLQEVAGELIRFLSLGFRKRLGLADALALHPKVLLLDDPLAGLDLPHRKKIASVLLSASARSAVLVTGHEVQEMLNWCTRVAVLTNESLNALYRVSEHENGELMTLLERQIAKGSVQEETS